MPARLAPCHSGFILSYLMSAVVSAIAILRIAVLIGAQTARQSVARTAIMPEAGA